MIILPYTTCSIPGCSKKAITRAEPLCSAHYSRKQRWGSPLASAPSVPKGHSLPGETWLPVQGYETNYEVSSLGRIRSLNASRNYQAGHIMAPSSNRYGYYVVNLRRDGTSHGVSLHRLVAKAFIPNPQQLPQVNHKNGVKTDNRVQNLEWVSARQNIRHRFDTLKHSGHVGESHPAHKLTERDVVDIRARYAAGGIRQVDLANQYGVTASAISAIICRTKWKHVP